MPICQCFWYYMGASAIKKTAKRKFNNMACKLKIRADVGFKLRAVDGKDNRSKKVTASLVLLRFARTEIKCGEKMSAWASF